MGFQSLCTPSRSPKLVVASGQRPISRCEHLQDSDSDCVFQIFCGRFLTDLGKLLASGHLGGDRPCAACHLRVVDMPPKRKSKGGSDAGSQAKSAKIHHDFPHVAKMTDWFL